MVRRRVCLPCTACCDGWVKIDQNGIEATLGKPCSFSSSKGCTNYQNRPAEPCRKFECAWIQANSPLPVWMKPNVSKAIVLPEKFRFSGTPVDVAVPVGKEIPPHALNWLKDFAMKTGRPLIFLENKVEENKFTNETLLQSFGPDEFLDFIHSKVAADEINGMLQKLEVCSYP